jgi:hypothetical protein
MNLVPYEAAALPIRDDLAAAHRRVWDHIARPGTWFDAATRVAIAAETRNAEHCRLCRRRKEALAPAAIAGEHDNLGELPAALVEIVHRVRTDPGRLTRRWLDTQLNSGVAVEENVEVIGILAHVVALDTFARALGIPVRALPAPIPGAPSRRRPAGARPGGAWVPWIAPEDVTEAEAGMYPQGRPPANIHKAMSLVPAEVASFFDLCEAQYLPAIGMRDFGREFRAITHAQIELLAARVSALNRCRY